MISLSKLSPLKKVMFVSKILTHSISNPFSLTAFLLHFPLYYQTFIERKSFFSSPVSIAYSLSLVNQPISKIPQEMTVIVNAEDVNFHGRTNKQKQQLKSYKMKKIFISKYRIKKETITHRQDRF